ncbi:transcriptional regulator protein-like protein [Marine Group I thaumarchaeote SCGC AAA799-E16]|uniref:Transcriptional regulator protein-like protein n=4 Tax=Marine Group I TaxID=905826 RepID=A0A081RMU4_9ARCH|nr:transcriptional regulator protein-like protein [Marine Group I thaumarchaeote SCGC AAA799-N04]KER05633.1 transcriptional regulator protein-like protein [Marine Group I thaumarchaeote SCGC AAA799-E16]KFM15570.1 transcriptional regulator protein-like protein [Marine Group I thaumarchaeote SCGC AAA799-D11]KFM16770.1 transcriptional regulator protein-like protein [Marine Group I thaumarchaeote SCGC RSA3]
MADLIDEAADYVLELASSQRLSILIGLLTKQSTPTAFAKSIDSTKQEVHRNFSRLEKAGLIKKNIGGTYSLTTFGQVVCTQVPSLVFLSQNRKYFEEHNFGDVPHKFQMRCGQLANAQYVKGVSKVLETWKSIYKNSNEYIYEILSEVPLDLIEPLVKRVKKGVKFNYIFSESAVVPKGRKALLKKLGFDKLMEKGLIERKMEKDVKTVVVLNEKEACLMFPTLDGESDISEMLYSGDPMFHEWCLDYFRYCWYGSDIFKESKLKE